ncbi:MAG: IS66 family insertion sequence element accessory protein TnpB, partial [Pontiellaceae bacterium]|nr:IS66 family insertion sequence element accessory protein TnpB [Pontiellaceae bacterium]
LFWDGTGMWVAIKRLEQGCFTWPKGVGAKHRITTISPALTRRKLRDATTRH